MRSSYSTPAAFISAIFSVLSWSSCSQQDDVRVLEDRLDQRQHVERVGRRRRGRAAPSVSSRYSDSVWLSEKSRCSSALTSTTRPRTASSGTTSMMPRVAQRAEAGRGAAPLLALLARSPPCERAMIADQPPVAAAARRARRVALQQVRAASVRDLEARLERLGRAVDAAARRCPCPSARSPSCGGFCITTFLPPRLLARPGAGSRSRARAPAPPRCRARRSPCARRARRSAGSRARRGCRSSRRRTCRAG